MTVKQLEKRVKILRDIEEIKKMHRDYLFDLSNCEWEHISEYFAKNAVAHIVRQDAPNEYDIAEGKEQIGRLLKDGMGKSVAAVRPKGGHLLFHPVIAVEGDTATGYWRMNRFIYESRLPATPISWLVKGECEAKYVREVGKWKFSYLKWSCPWSEREKTA